MIDIVAAVNDEAVLRANLLRSPMMSHADVAFHAQRGFASAGAAFAAALPACRGDVAVFVHQDVYLPAGWRERLERHVARLDALDERWAVLGLYGVTAEGRQVGQLWSSGLQAVVGAPFDEPVRVQSIDEVLIVRRRACDADFDPALPGWHLYATDLVQSAIARGRTAYAICAPVVHNSRSSPFLGADYFRAYRYVARKWRDRLPIGNNVACVLPPGPRYLALRLRHKLAELRRPRGAPARVDRGLDCVAIARGLALE